MPAVTVSALTKSYGPLKAVNGIDLAIETGEVVAILGPNGAGKTTTVEMMEGFRKPDSGTITVLGHDPSGRPAELLDRIGIVLQEGGIEEDLTVREAIEAQRRPYSDPLPVEETIETVDLVEKADERIKTLSGGQRRRLDLALGIVGNPDLLFLDEPTTGFDPAARRRSWEAIRQLAKSGTTVVLTTHYLEEAQELADRVVVMSMGEIVADGSPDDLGDRRSGVSTVRLRIEPAAAGALGVDSDPEGRVTIETHDPIRVVNELTTRALTIGVSIEDFEVGKITLEEAYLRLVSRHE